MAVRKKPVVCKTPADPLLTVAPPGVDQNPRNDRYPGKMTPLLLLWQTNAAVQLTQAAQKFFDQTARLAADLLLGLKDTAPGQDSATGCAWYRLPLAHATRR